MNLNKENFSLRLSFKDTLFNWCETSTAHAIPNIVRTKSILLQVIWACCFLASGSYCLFSIVVSTQNYLSNQTFVSTKIIQEIPTIFPAVTICNFKQLNKVRSHDFIQSILFYPNGTSKLNEDQFGDDIYSLIATQQTMIQGVASRYPNISSLAYQFSELFITCKFRWNTCDASDFEQFYHPLYGNCFTFNAQPKNGSLKQSYVPGPDYGLIIEMFLGDPNIENDYETNDGVIVVVHNRTTVPLLNNDRVLAALGAETDLKINRRFLERLPAPYGNCLKDTSKQTKYRSELFDYIVHELDMEYNQQFCYALCVQKSLVDTCNCTFGFLPSFKTYQSCVIQPEIICGVKSIHSFNVDVCISGCPLECDSIEYSVKTSRATFPSIYYRKKLLQKHSKINASGIAEKDLDRALLRLNVFYETMTYELVVESAATTAETFFSNMGGTLGLYLGISVLSVIEVIELGIKLIQVAHIYRYQKKAEEKSSKF